MNQRPVLYNVVAGRPIRFDASWGAMILVAALLLAGAAHAAGGDLLWEDQVDHASGSDIAVAVAAHRGMVVAAGSTLRTYDGRTGRLLWEDSSAGPVSTVAMHSKQVVAVGSGLVRTYDSKSGKLLWAAPGTVDVALHSGLVITFVGDAVVAYDRVTGIIRWVGSAPSGARALTVHGEMTFAVGTIQNSSGPPLCAVRAYATDTGEQLWESIDESCRGLAITARGKRVVVTGQGSAGLDDFQIQGYEASSGEFMWEDRTFVSTGTDNAGVALDEQGKLAFAVGWVRHEPSPFNQEAFLTRAYDSGTGSLIWEDQFLPSDQRCLCHALDVAVHGSQVYVVGTDVAFSRFQVLVYDKHDGGLMWEDHVVEAGGARAVAADGNRVYAVGSIPNANGDPDFLIRAYDAK